MSLPPPTQTPTVSRDREASRSGNASSAVRDPRTESLGDLYPFHAHHLDIDGQRMHYLDEGAGPPLLMLHGNPTWSFYYRHLVCGLRDRYRVIVPDHIGCGLSDKPQTYDYTLRTHIANAETLLDHLRLNDVTLVVHDWGGAIGFGLATRRPEGFRRFVVFNTAAFLGGRVPWRIRMCRIPILGEWAVRALNGFARCATYMACAKHDRMMPAVKRGYLLPYDSYAHRIATHRFVKDIPLRANAPSHGVIRDIESKLAGLRDRPMSIFWGMKDFCFTPAFLEEWVTRFPDAEVHRFADAGHYVVEDAHEQILPAMNQFLERSD